MRIAICDDTVDEINAIKNIIDSYKSDFEITYDCFTNGVEFLSKVSLGEFYDLIFLDIVMPVINGIEVAKEIYSNNKVSQIVFLTTSQDYAVESYDVNAIDYIIKPITKESFKRALERYTEKNKIPDSGYIIVQEQSSITKIALHNLCYVEILDHYLAYHLTNSDIIRCRQSLYEIEPILNQYPNFCKTHRSYIVNMEYAQRIEKDCIVMKNGERALVSRRNHKNISDIFLKNIFESKLTGE